jgi:hypothetical protein
MYIDPNFAKFGKELQSLRGAQALAAIHVARHLFGHGAGWGAKEESRYFVGRIPPIENCVLRRDKQGQRVTHRIAQSWYHAGLGLTGRIWGKRMKSWWDKKKAAEQEERRAAGPSGSKTLCERLRRLLA